MATSTTFKSQGETALTFSQRVENVVGEPLVGLERESFRGQVISEMTEKLHGTVFETENDIRVAFLVDRLVGLYIFNKHDYSYRMVFPNLEGGVNVFHKELSGERSKEIPDFEAGQMVNDLEVAFMGFSKENDSDLEVAIKAILATLTVK